MRRFMDVQYGEYEETKVDIYLPDTDNIPSSELAETTVFG